MSRRRSARLQKKASQDGSFPPLEPVQPAPKSGAKKATRTVSLSELPSWQHDNEYIMTGYRREMQDWSRVLFSAVGYVHNETVNIWTHVFGSIVALACFASIYIFDKPGSSAKDPLYLENPFGLVNPLPHRTQSSVTWKDAAVHAIFFFSAAFCLFGSATFHCVNCHSEKISRSFNRLDYVGIVVLIVGSFWPAVYYGFYCHESLQHFYLFAITFAGSATTYTVVAPHYRTPAYRRMRTYVFISLGLSAFLPIIHALLLYGWRHSNEVFELRFLVLEGVLYIGGALLYAERIPERYFPGRFDLFGASHQIFHVMINLAAWSHYVAVAAAFRHRHDTGDIALVERTTSHVSSVITQSSQTPSHEPTDPENEPRLPSSLAPVDRGKDAWTFVACATVLEAMLWGFPYSWGVLQQYLTSHPPFNSYSPVAVGSTGTVELGILFSSLFVNFQVFARYPEYLKPAICVAMFVVVASLFVSSFATQVYQLLILQGILFGSAAGVVTIGYLIWLWQWFSARRGLATGIVFAGAGLGGAVFPLLLGQMLGSLGFPWTMRIWSGITAFSCGLALLGLKPRLPLPPKGSRRAPFVPRDLSFFASPVFWAMSFIIALQGLGYLSVSLYISTFSVSLGYSEAWGQVSLSIFNICAFFGQVGMGWATYSYTAIMAASGAMCALSALLLWGLASTIALVLVFAAVFAMFGGGFSTVWSVAASEIATKNPQQAGLVFSLFSVVKGVAAIVGPTIAGALHDPNSARSSYGQFGFQKMVIFVGATMLASCMGCAAAQVLRVRSKSA